MGIIGGPPIGGVGSMPGRGGPPVLQTANVSEQPVLRQCTEIAHESDSRVSQLIMLKHANVSR